MIFSLFDKRFELAGFQSAQGASFVVDPTGAAGPSQVPLPEATRFALTGIGAMGVIRR